MHTDATSSFIVSFVIPTLNRRGYVTRAVRSCLAQEADGVTVEVIVLDSQSDDGSWEELTAAFSSDARVKLIQNERGKGPTASWIEGACHATGQAVTFLWSDDYIFPGFVRTLLPPIIAGASVSFGQGLVRDIDTDSLPTATEVSTVEFDAPRACTAFLKGFDYQFGYLPASPACALFAASGFRFWIEHVRDFSTSSRLASYFLWERAVGPDLLLFLIAASEHGQAGTAAAIATPVCQFSAHPGSITVSSPQWIIDVGYWLTRTLWYMCGRSDPALDGFAHSEITARLVAHGLLLACTTPRGVAGGRSRWRLALSLLVATWRTVRRSRSGRLAIVAQLGRLVGEQAGKRAKALLGGSSS